MEQDHPNNPTNSPTNNPTDSPTNNPTNTNNTKTHYPRRYFKLTELTSRNALADIQARTNNFDPQYGISDEFSNQLTQSLDNDNTTFRGYIHAPTHTDTTKKVIGKDGCYFKLTTTNTHISFIWHDRTNNLFLFWGNKPHIFKAMNIINSRIQKYTTTQSTT